MQPEGFSELGERIPFYKLQGCGNDFVIIDNRELAVAPDIMPTWAKRICRKAFGVGADGLIFLDHAPQGSGVDYMWHFFNSDGSRAEMCGNGSRCATRLAYLLGIAPAEHSFLSDAGPIKAVVYPGTNQVKVQLTPPQKQQLNIDIVVDGKPMTVHFVDTGVPHTVVVENNLQELDIKPSGSAIRFHERFAPAGTNVNFIRVEDSTHVSLRTYERGVEDETYACGTGACASVIVAHALGLTDNAAIVTTSGGEKLEVSLWDGNVFLKGSAELVFSGHLYLQSLGM
ncbi:diaminopimelate epimerase [Desulfovibrio inopinatus]|uniref:diaminopimelate epimerase n=1 Tax=Desulfovibrio inopinatus TaxID=102109 RepID=UPI0004031DE0|nr:diaminopimelate epimerase [Desulfovibrio inopinatus]